MPKINLLKILERLVDFLKKLEAIISYKALFIQGKCYPLPSHQSWTLPFDFVSPFSETKDEAAA